MSTQAGAASATPDLPVAALPAGGREPVLLIEREEDLAQTLIEQLRADGHPAEAARSAGHAQYVAALRPPRLLLLGELDTPRGALDLLEGIRNGPSEDPSGRVGSPWPVEVAAIVLGSRSSQPDLLRAFEAGADDFLARPVRYLELRARLRAVLRRCQPTIEQRPLQVGPLTIDRAACKASLHEKPLQLRRLEYELLAHLASSPDRVFRRDELLSAVWGFRSPGTTRTLDSHASRLRRKLSGVGDHWIINVRGIGYRLK